MKEVKNLIYYSKEDILFIKNTWKFLPTKYVKNKFFITIFNKACSNKVLTCKQHDELLYLLKYNISINDSKKINYA